MGSFRRGLIAAALFMPTTALAEVCDKERPDWDGLPVAPFAEAVILFSTIPSLILIAATMLALRFRSVWGGLFVVLCWSSLLTALISLDPSGLRDTAKIEGCRGDPVLFIGVVIAICIGTILYTAPRNVPKPSGDD